MSGCAGCSLGNKFNPGGNYVGIRINENEDGRLLFCETQGLSVDKGDWVVVEGDRGLDFGQITTVHPLIVKQCQIRDARKLLRMMSDSDRRAFETKKQTEARIFNFTKQFAADRGLPIKLVRTELTYDGRKVIVSYTCEKRIDYRDLVRDLSQEFQVRVEMRQIGVRDETRIRGGIGPCGKTLCCSTFLRSFHPVTIKMAKNQNLSLNPSKISGMCGRLMCCLAYEDEGPPPSRVA
jgi:cell fate regulator YaaT (PSP1 superfamily)